jgi:hypothetical protein
MRRAVKVFTRRLPVKKSHVRFFSGKASHEHAAPRPFYRGLLRGGNRERKNVGVDWPIIASA